MSAPATRLASLPVALGHSAPQARRWDWLVWGGFALALVIKGGAFSTAHSTYPCFVAGSLCWWHDLNPYDLAVCPHEYRYSPIFSALFAPFALLPAAVGAPLFALLSMGILATGWSRVERAGLLGDASGEPPSLETSRAMGLLFLLGISRGMWALQTNGLIIGLVLWAAAALVEKRYWLAAALLMLPVAIKVWPLALVALLWLRWPRELIGRTLVVGLLLALIPFCVKPWGMAVAQYSEWFRALVGPMQVRHMYRDLWTVWEYCWPPVPSEAYRLVQLGGAAATAGLCLWMRRGHTLREQLWLTLALWAAWQIVLGPGTERNTYGILAPFTAYGLMRPQPYLWVRGLLGVGAGMTLFLSFGYFERTLARHTPAAEMLLPLGALVFTLGLVAAILLRREKYS